MDQHNSAAEHAGQGAALSNRQTSILAATTPQDNSTYHAYLINVKDPETGKRVFNVVNLVEVCKACLASAKPWKCTHMSERISGSKSEAARRQTMLFYRPGQKHVAMRELMGQQASGNGGLLASEWVEAFHASEVLLRDRPRAIYLGIDPGGGGPGELGVVGIVETMSMERGAQLAVGFLFFRPLSILFFYCFIRISVTSGSAAVSLACSTRCHSHASRRLSE